MYERKEVLLLKYDEKNLICGCNFFKPQKCQCKDCIETVVTINPYTNIEDCINNGEIDVRKV